MKTLFTFFILFSFSFTYGQVLPNNWTGDTGIDTYKESTTVHGGVYSCKVDVNTGTQGDCDMRHDVVSVTAGDSYSYSFYIQSSAHVKARVVLEWVGASITYGNYSSISTSSFDHVTATGTVPTGATAVKIGVRFYDQSGFSAPETQYIDDFTFESPSGTSITLANGNMESWSTSNSLESRITKKSGWSEPINIAYASYSATSGLTTSNSIEVASFTILDGNGSTADADAVSTILTGLSIDIANWENLKAIAIFDGNTNVGEVTTMAATIGFSSLTLTAADDATKDFTLRATFNSNVTDNDNLKFTISSATADNAGSSFAAADAGGAATDDTGNNNKIVVTADRLRFDANKPPSIVKNTVNFDVKVESTDVNGSIDADATNSITIVRASGTGVLSSATGLTQSLINGVYEWTDVQYDTDENFTIEAQNTSLNNVTSGTIICTSGPTMIAWINEFHYDNSGADTDERVEICIINASSYTLSDFTVTLYNGANGNYYNTKTLNNYTVGTTYDNVSTYYYNYTPSDGGIQNGAPDGIALSYNDGTKAIILIEFISYEGDFTAADGPASGVQSQDVGVIETGSTVTGNSIGRVGNNDEFTWETGNSSTWGAENNKSGGGTQVLPVEIIFFSAESINNHIELNWQTATETNNEFFTIERSLDAENFEIIGTVWGAGNSNELLNYSFSDNDINSKSIIYYRLKQTDYDGNYSYSKTISVLLNITETQLVSQSIIDGDLVLNIQSADAQEMQIELLDLTGKLIQLNTISTQKGNNNYRIQLQNIPNGIYLMRIYSDTEMMVRKLYIN